MIDAHIHLEKGEYTLEWLSEFIRQGVENNLSELWFLEHTHVFREFASLYDEMSKYNTYQGEWFQKKTQKARPLSDYLQFVSEMKQHHFPLNVRFGLEVCYSPEQEETIRTITSPLKLDFLVGSIHFIDGWAFSHRKQQWTKEEVDLLSIYERYYELMTQLVDADLFSGLAHPNSLQCFGAYPPKDYSLQYMRLARLLKKKEMYIEASSGLKINYGDQMLGMNPTMLYYMKKYGVKILTASDAHVPENVGRYVKEMDAAIH